MDTLSIFDWEDLGLFRHTYPYLSIGTQYLHQVCLTFDGYGYVISVYRDGLRSILGCFAEAEQAQYAFWKVKLIYPPNALESV